MTGPRLLGATTGAGLLAGVGLVALNVLVATFGRAVNDWLGPLVLAAVPATVTTGCTAIVLHRRGSTARSRRAFLTCAGAIETVTAFTIAVVLLGPVGAVPVVGAEVMAALDFGIAIGGTVVTLGMLTLLTALAAMLLVPLIAGLASPAAAVRPPFGVGWHVGAGAIWVLASLLPSMLILAAPLLRESQ